MKKSLIIVLFSLFIFACNQSNTSGTAADDTTMAGENQSATAQQSGADTNVNKIGTDAGSGGSKSLGEVLISKSDCLTCHRVNEKIIGPTYIDVANKYSPTDANKELLVSKIIAGGSGVWGTVPMAPHPNISKEDAKEMVNYILSLKTN